MNAYRRNSEAPVERVKVSAFTIPTETPESDGTLEWDQTTLVLVEVTAGNATGLGYTYADAAAAKLIHDKLRPEVEGNEGLDVPARWADMHRIVRNLGRPGLAATAISAVDSALWDLKARLLGVSLLSLLGAAKDRIPVYGSGGFTSYSVEKLQEQLGGWVREGISRVKMKVGRHPDRDLDRIRAAREAIGPNTELFIDANGAYSRKQALFFAHAAAECGVRWFEEPVVSEDLEGLRLLRDQGPPGMEITAGEYGYMPPYFRRMIDAGAVDVMMADATRCAGITGFMQVAALCEAACLPLSSHTAPALHAHPCCALRPVRHVEYFFDHVRIERMLFDGAPEPVDGELIPDRSRPGMGLEFKRADAEPYAV